MRNNRLQNRVTTGRITLPVVILVCIVCWIATAQLLPYSAEKATGYSFWQTACSSLAPGYASRIVSFMIYAFIGYFLIEINNTLSIIRMRASVQTSLYFLFITACPALHVLYAGDVAAVAFLLSLYFLLKSYQQPRPVGFLFNSFLFIGIGSLAFPQLTFFTPIWLIGAYNFHSLTFRSLCGAIIGWCMPFWFLFAYAFFHGQMELFYQPFVELANFQHVRFMGNFQPWQLVTLGYLFTLFIVSSIHSAVTAYQDKIRTRSYLHFIMLLNCCIFLFIFLQPMHCSDLLSLLLIGVSILTSHLFVLTNNRTSNIFFICSMVGLILLFGFNVWTLLYNYS